MLRCKLFVARITTAADVAKSKSDVYFLQHEKLLRLLVISQAAQAKVESCA